MRFLQTTNVRPRFSKEKRSIGSAAGIENALDYLAIAGRV
jgi:hypothetical protein